MENDENQWAVSSGQWPACLIAQYFPIIIALPLPPACCLLPTGHCPLATGLC